VFEKLEKGENFVVHFFVLSLGGTFVQALSLLVKPDKQDKKNKIKILNPDS